VGSAHLSMKQKTPNAKYCMECRTEIEKLMKILGESKKTRNDLRIL
jgi:hypothetical protein